MANSKITDLTSLTAAAGDEIPVNRAGSDGKITVGDIVALGIETLTAARDYYVRSDGSDSNTGLVNSAGGAFLTMQKAFDTVSALNLGEYDVTINVGAGSFVGGRIIGPILGSGGIIISGAGTGSTTFTKDTVNNTGDTFLLERCRVTLAGGFTFGASSGDFTTYIETDDGAYLGISASIAITGDATDTFISNISSTIQIAGSNTITVGSSGLGQFILLSAGATLGWSSTNVTFTSTPNIDAFGTGAIEVGENSNATFYLGTVTGSSTGIKYVLSGGGYIHLFNKTISTFPFGATAGTVEFGCVVDDTAGTRRGHAPVVTLTDGATPALDASLGDLFVLTAAGDRTIAVPSNATSGQKIVIRHVASGANRTLALNTGAGGFRYGTDITGLTVTASGKTDYIGAIYNSTDSKWDVVSYVKGF